MRSSLTPPPDPKYATYSPDRTPKWKYHSTKGKANASITFYRGKSRYSYELWVKDDENGWQLIEH